MLTTEQGTLPPLREVLTESVSAVQTREANALNDLLHARNNRCVIFGAGTLDRRAVVLLRKIGVEPLAICDSNQSRWGTEISGVPVLSPDGIERDQPILAICVYHTQSDVWRIPLLIRSIDPTYRLFLRAYDGDGFQSVVYAVPPQRLLSEAERAAAPNPRKPSDI